jgi:hypothetical protein
MALYFPSNYAKGRQCDREYLFNIANTLHPDVIKELFQHAHNHRYSVSGEKQAQESIIVSNEWADELKSMPFFSKVSLFVKTKYLFRKKEKWWLYLSKRQRLERL